jgi:hypothetical protein
MARKVVLNVTPDRLDLRDRPYLPAVALAPPPALAASPRPAPMDQGRVERVHRLRAGRSGGPFAGAVGPRQGHGRVALDALLDGAALRRVSRRVRRRRLEPSRRDEGLVQARRLLRGAVEEHHHAAGPGRRARRAVVAGRGEPSAGRVLPRRHALGHRHARCAERGGRPLRERAHARRLVRGRRQDGEDPARQAQGLRRRPRVRDRGLRPRRFPGAQFLGRIVGATAATRRSHTRIGSRTPWIAGSRSWVS